MRNTRFAMIATLFIVVTGAYSQEVHYNYERGANFAAYKTYQWVEVPGSAPNADAVPAPPSGNLPAPPAGLPPVPPPYPGGAPHFPATSEVRSGGSEDQFVDRDIKRAVDEQLAQKGLANVEKNGDLLVTYHVAIHQELSISLFGSGWPQKAYGGWPNGYVDGQTSTIPIGTLVVDLYDPAAKRLIWRGGATKSIELKKDPDKNYKNLQKAMVKLFKNYPPPPNK